MLKLLGGDDILIELVKEKVNFKVGIICIIIIIVNFILSIDKDRNFSYSLIPSFKEYMHIFKRKDKKYDKKTVLSYVLSPIIFAFILSLIRTIDPDISENISVIMSIIISMLFTLFSKMQEYKSKVLKDKRLKKSGNEYNLVLNLIKETLAVITFLITLSAYSLLLLLVVMFINLEDSGILLSFLIYSSIIMVIKNIMIVIKRFNNISKEIEDIN